MLFGTEEGKQVRVYEEGSIRNSEAIVLRRSTKAGGQIREGEERMEDIGRTERRAVEDSRISETGNEWPRRRRPCEIEDERLSACPAARGTGRAESQVKFQTKRILARLTPHFISLTVREVNCTRTNAIY